MNGNHRTRSKSTAATLKNVRKMPTMEEAQAWRPVLPPKYKGPKPFANEAEANAAAVNNPYSRLVYLGRLQLTLRRLLEEQDFLRRAGRDEEAFALGPQIQHLMIQEAHMRSQMFLKPNTFVPTYNVNLTRQGGKRLRSKTRRNRSRN